MGGKAAGALANLLPLGSEFPAMAAEQCLAPLITALVGDRRDSVGHRPRIAKMLGALTNLLTTNVDAIAASVKLGVIGVALNFLDDWEVIDAEAGQRTIDEEEASIAP